MCTQVGDNAYKEFERELDQERIEEEKIENKIRQMRKERNRARLHPTREQGPAKKRRKVGENNEYINIKEVWGEPTKNTQVKHKNKDTMENQGNKRTKVEQESQEQAQSENKENENNVDDGELGVQDWDKEIENHGEQLIREQRTETAGEQEVESTREQSWELKRLCQEFLEENDEKWAKRKALREKELAKVLRLEKAGILGRKAKLEQLRRNIQKGESKLPQKEKEKLEKDENKKRKLELQAIKQDLWKLRKHENKNVRTERTKRLEEIQNLAEKS